MQIIPLQPIPNQTVTVNLNGQNTQVDVYTTPFGLFMNVYVSNTLVVAGVICQNLNRIVRDLYLNFQGDLAFLDSQGDADPVYTGLGSRFSLGYLEPDELLPNEG